MNINKNWFFIGVCLFLAVMAEVSLFSHPVGISYSVFVATFYIVFFAFFRKQPFHHKQISGLLFLTLGVLTITFAVYSNPLFNVINFMLIPLIVFVHTVLLTSSTTVRWDSKDFLVLLVKKIKQLFHFVKLMAKISSRQTKRKVNKSTYKTAMKISLGVLISMPLVVVITILLSAADEKFADLLIVIPEMLASLDTDVFWRFIKILIFAIVFYCYFKVVTKKTRIKERLPKVIKRNWDTIIIATILIFINLIYLLFAIVQFQYLFSGALQEGFSYAEYARRGFFELVLVTIINYFILLSTITFVKNTQAKTVKVLLTFLIAFSGVLLSSAFIRLMLYEQAYGFTTSRILAHSFMIFLFIILAYTLVKVWINRLPLARFYLIAVVLYYVGLNLVGIDQLIVSKNIERYEETEKIDIEYLDQLSYSAVPALLELYQENPEIIGLKSILLHKQVQISSEDGPWQSFNLSRERAKKALQELK